MIFLGTPIAKAMLWVNTVAYERRGREQKPLDTAVVYSVNDDYYSCGLGRGLSKRVNNPPQ